VQYGALMAHKILDCVTIVIVKFWTIVIMRSSA
jgi:hypothetical protein